MAVRGETNERLNARQLYLRREHWQSAETSLGSSGFFFALGYTVLRARRFFQGDSCKVISGDFEFFSLSAGSREKGIRVVVKFSI